MLSVDRVTSVKKELNLNTINNCTNCRLRKIFDRTMTKHPDIISVKMTGN